MRGFSNGGGYQDVFHHLPGIGPGRRRVFGKPQLPGQAAGGGYVEDLAGMAVVSNYSDLVKDLMTIDGKVPGLAMELAVLACTPTMTC